ncbi:MAG: FtsQ-type POTRA domain-containing protein [Oscillospiraceae bacterium]|nr:FtsQ-type POTRA domain-containing protein [Oscillospiraceae bacterium]
MPEFHSYNRNNKNGRRPENEENSAQKDNKVSMKMPKMNKKAKKTKELKKRDSGYFSTSPEKRKVRKSYVIHLTLLSIFCVILLGVLSVTVLFNVDEVFVLGDSPYSAEEIMEAGGIEIAQNLSRFKSGQAQQSILSSLVRLDDVMVRRVFPNAIEVTVEYAESVFSVYSGGEFHEISPKGRIIGIGSKRPKGLVVDGFDTESAVAGDYLEYVVSLDENGKTNADDIEKIELIFSLAALIEKHGLSEIVRIDISDRYDVKLFNGINERVEVKLGAPTQLDEKLAITASIINDEIAENEKGILRVSTPRKASFNPVLN